MIDQYNWLDFGNLFINELIGDLFLSIIIISLVIVYVGLKKNINIHTIIALLLIANLGLAGYYYSSMVVIIIGMIVSLGYFTVASRLISR